MNPDSDRFVVTAIVLMKSRFILGHLFAYEAPGHGDLDLLLEFSKDNRSG